MKLYLIGTAHRYQKGLRCVPSGCYDEFKKLVHDATVRYATKTIAEELSKDVLGKDAVSLCAEVAEELSIPHAYCDPNEAERIAAGLPVKDCPSTWGPREHEWLRRLSDYKFPMLFVCGANHVDSFARKCRAQAIVVEVLAGDWEPDQQIPLDCLSI